MQSRLTGRQTIHACYKANPHAFVCFMALNYQTTRHHAIGYEARVSIVSWRTWEGDKRNKEKKATCLIGAYAAMNLDNGQDWKKQVRYKGREKKNKKTKKQVYENWIAV